VVTVSSEWEHGGPVRLDPVHRAAAAAAAEIVAFTEVHNLRSCAVMERPGMSCAGPFDHHRELFVRYTITRAAAPGNGQRT
jgi:hypothetical protein